MPKLIFKSHINKNFVLAPIMAWLFFTLLAIFICVPAPHLHDDTFAIDTFLKYLVVSVLVLGLIIWNSYVKQTRIEIVEGILTYYTLSGKPIAIYKLEDICDFKWSNRAIGHSAKGRSVRVKFEYIEIHFKAQEYIMIQNDEFKNFEELRKMLFNYCVQNKIINIRPLQERKRSLKRIHNKEIR